jgi:NADPH:quinone reductase-like Zn-dependent oxidoreductase
MSTERWTSGVGHIALLLARRLGARVLYDGVPSQSTLEWLNALIEAGPFHLEIGHVYAMEEAARAQKEVLQHHLGKLALRIH